ncbi:MAG TPA: radical SAM protein, partial [Syntrophomonas sp.]|nr:radical SAM protein [Syntrophomonas sp.]
MHFAIIADMTDSRSHSHKRIFLVLPAQKFVNYYGQTELCKMMGKKKFMVSLAMPMIAAITPPEYDVRIIDEELEPLPVEIPEIVGISALATTAKRAYEIGDWYRSHGAKVIIGGPYVSYMTDEAVKHADAIVIGEAEGAWQQCLKDYEQGCLQQIYNIPGYCDFKEIPPPRWDLVDMKKVFQVGIQVSRGCPYKCEFCLVTSLFGNKMRYRDIDNVVQEIKSLPVRKMLFVDDNLTANKRYAHDLMKALLPLKISWGCMSSIDIAKDDDLLTEMNNAGCFNILIGFESLNAESLYETRKRQNRDALIYEEAIKKIHSHGIHITASFVIGFDNDTPEEFDHLYEFTQRTGLSYINFNILGAPYGTELQKRLTAEGRMYDIDSDMMGGLFPCIHYFKMSQIELFDKYLETLTRMYSYESVYFKAKILFGDGYFTKSYNDGNPSVAFRAKLVFKLLREFIFTNEPYKRKFFLYMISLIRQKKAAIDMGLS